MYSPHGLEPWKPLHDAGRVRIVIRTQVVQHARAHECVDARTVRWLDLDGRQLGVFFILHNIPYTLPRAAKASSTYITTRSYNAVTMCGSWPKSKKKHCTPYV